MRSSFFWDVTQRWLVVIYRRFGRGCQSHLQRSLKMGQIGPWRWDRYALPTRRSISTNQCCVTTQKTDGVNIITEQHWRRTHKSRKVWHEIRCYYGTSWLNRLRFLIVLRRKPLGISARTQRNPDRLFSYSQVYSVPPGKCSDSTLN